ncbi:MAG: primosomal protein N' [Lachnospiraceae bacterium]|nr:primosomal protein N' [Lachnospiraceae bacterium]
MFANIIVDISHEKLDRTFQYAIPKKLEDKIFPGVCVDIPFGKGNRVITGFVLEVTDKCEFDISKIKELLGISKKAAPVEARLISLAWWIKQNYGSTMNKALKTLLPAKQKISKVIVKHVHLNLSEDETKQMIYELSGKDRFIARKRLLEELLEKKVLPYDIITGKLNVSASVIKGLADKGIVRIVTKENYRNPVKISNSKAYDIVLNEEQQKVCDEIWMEPGKVHLLHGITGSGKTEVYIELISRVVERGGQAIVLIPEIALTYQTLTRFFAKFGDRVTYIHSRQSAGEKYDQLERAKAGDVDVMIGPRSALFTPFANLELIIIDEEHENAYKSENVPKYHAREVAKKRAETEGATLVLGSATPSVESFYKAQKGEYILHKLSARAKGSSLPDVEVVDLRDELKRGNKNIISVRLDELIRQRLERKEQIMLFINRRGYAGFVSCRSCGHVLKCPHCDVSLTYHNDGKVKCHYCGYEVENPKTCPECGSKYIGKFGTGTQKIEEAVKKLYPNARVLRMDMDTTSGKDGHTEILSKFANREADILVGTQMIVKGHDFPYVTLVGVLAADLSLYSGDYTAAEKTFQLITQAAGRAGRGNAKGCALIQTYNPEETSIIAASKQDYNMFYENEIRYRKLLGYPPIMEFLVILLTGTNEELLDKRAKDVAETINKSENSLEDVITVIGPTKANIAKINDVYRRVFYLKSTNYADLVRIKDILESKYEGSEKDIGLYFDFSPLSKY